MPQLTEKQKYEIVILREQNRSIRYIAKYMNINAKAVTRWLNRYKNTDSIKRKPGSGRRKKTSKEEDNEIISKIDNNNVHTIKDIQKILSEKSIDISKSTIRRRLNENDIIYTNPTRKPLLTARHRELRLNWALNNTSTNWENVLFSDETSVWKNTYKKKYWMDKKNKKIERTVKYPLKVHVWGCISIGGTETIEIFTGIMDANKYWK